VDSGRYPFEPGKAMPEFHKAATSLHGTLREPYGTAPGATLLGKREADVADSQCALAPGSGLVLRTACPN